jgi:ABC-2 type transport system permease protein
MDPQNAAFPAPVTRQVGGFSFQELVMLDYPYFIDVRPPGLNESIAVTAGLPQVTLAWASPLETQAEALAGKSLTPLLESSPQSWISTDPDVMPRISERGLSGFEPAGTRGSRTLALLLEGQFQSHFAGKPSPLLDRPESELDEQSAEDEEASADGEPESVATEDKLGVVTSVIERSPESARLFVLGSNDFLADQVLRVIGSAEGTLYGNSIQLMANAVDYALEDRNLLEIRSRGHFNRTLPPMESARQVGLESLNYGFALGGVGLVFLWHRRRVNRDENRYRSWLAEGSA